MKTKIFVLIVLVFGFTFGQVKVEIVEDETIGVNAIRWISEKCSDLTNIPENSKCVKKEIEAFVNRKIDWSVFEKLPKEKYIMKIRIAVETDGEITNVKATGGDQILNGELERVLMIYQNRIKMVDENGTTYRGHVNFPLTIQKE